MRVSSRSSVGITFTFGTLLPASALASGMPQLEFSNWLVQGQVFWGAGIFLVFYLALHFKALPKIERTLERRSSRIRNDLNLAQESKLSAEEAQEEMRRVQKEALAKAQAHIKSIQDSAREAAEKAAKEASDRLSKAHSEALAKLQSNLDDAFKELPQAAAEIATHVSTLLVPGLSKDSIKKLTPVVHKNTVSVKGSIIL